jgi:hypothetical protein
MGGGGTLQFGVRNPGLFASLDANVPHCPSPGQIESVTEDLPLLKFFHGRQDRAIRWGQVPPFIRALEEARQPFICAWNNGGHGGPTPEVSTSFRSYDYRELRSDQCLPAFTNASTADDPGNGDPADGDLVGAVNDDFRWQAEKDTADVLVLRLWRVPKTGKFADVTEATVDVTPRRRQAFRPSPGERVAMRNVAVDSDEALQQAEVTVEPSELFTVQRVRVGLEPGSRLTFTRSR